MNDSFELMAKIWDQLNGFEFGVIVNDNQFVTHLNSESDLELIHSQTIFQNHRKRFVIQLENKGSQEMSEIDGIEDQMMWSFDKYEFAINYSQIKSIHMNGENLVFKLIFPPLLYQICEEYNGIDYSSENSLNSEGNECLDKNCDNGFISDDELDHDFEELVSQLDEHFTNDPIEINNFDEMSEYSGIRLRTTTLNGINCENLTKINSIKLKLKDNKLIGLIIKNMMAFEPTIHIDNEIIDGFENDLNFENSNLIPSDLPFSIKYCLESLFNYSFHLMDCLKGNNTTVALFNQLVREFTAINPNVVEYTLDELRHNVENNLSMNPYFDFIETFLRLNNNICEKWTNDSIMYVRRCILTPTRILLLPALPLQQSRFLRTCNPEYCIRLLIKDEDFQLISHTACKHSLPDEHEMLKRNFTFLLNIIKDRLIDGLLIGDRVYEVLGASTSQLRDHGLVLYARDDRNRSASDICREIGEINGITNPAKFIARIGLSMSQSMGFVPDIDCIEMIDDITGGIHNKTGKPYTFSDGVGMISTDMAAELMSALKENIKTASVFQIRYAGMKGILVLNPELEGKQIKVRPSMKKFSSNSKDLDILKVSEPKRVYLNRPLVTILNDMGVTKEQLMTLLLETLSELSDAFSCDCKAIKLIKSYSTLKLPYNKILDSGIGILSDPLFVNMLNSIIYKVCIDLKNKARILIPLNKGRVMYGVLDETKTLNYGEVFVQYTDAESGAKMILTEKILVTKYPCMHAGDVRKLKAVDIPGLHHLVDCIVFPQKGDRPHPDEMAGSDLDGDEYSVIWYRPLIFNRDNYKPMDFPCGEASDLGRPVTVDDILEFYCTFIANNHVGIIASSHLAFSDFNSAGIFSSVCNILDRKYAVALDYAKTGINERLSNREKPNSYPDFMMKSNEKPTYRSSKALGILYQTNCYFNQTVEELAQHCNYELNEKLCHSDSHNFMADAEVMFDVYRTAINDLKQQFGIESESALISGSFTKTHKYFNTRNDNNDVHELVTNLINKLFIDLKTQFETGVHPAMLLAKASAWYQTSVKKNNESEQKFYGFAWIPSEYLTQLFINQTNQSPGHVCNQLIGCKTIEIESEKINRFVKNLIHYSFAEDSYLQPNQIHNYLNKVVNSVLQSESKVDLISTIDKILDQLLNLQDICDDETKLKTGVISLMVKYRVRKMNLIQVLKNSLNTSEGPNQLVMSVTIGIKLSDAIKECETKFRETVKRLTHILQIDILYGRKESSISVYGSKCSIEKFKNIIFNKFLSEDIISGNFFKN